MSVPLSRRSFLAPAVAPALLAQKKAAPNRPNILLILADDLAAWMLGCYGNQEIKTPHIDTLARTGARFLNNFVCTPICSASRATLFTGRTPRQHGIHDFLTAKPIETPPQGQAAPPDSFRNEIMISDVLAQAGYNCGYVGKWHMGADATPGHGFKSTYTMGTGRFQDPVMYRNGQKVEEKGYLTELLTADACRFLDEQKPGSPFFLVASYLNPHLPYDGHPQKYYDLYAKTPFTTTGWEPAARNALREKELLNDIVGNLRKCAASTTALDDQIPVLRRKLQERGLLDNTLIVFTGDNGFLLGRHGLWSKGLASDPINMYDEVVATPMIWSWPGRIPAEHVRPELVSFYDLMPSLCEVAGVDPPARNLCGRSYLPLAMNRPLPKKQPWPDTVFGHFRNTEMARDNRFKLVLRNDGQGPNEFYDLRLDPREKQNLYNEPRIVTVRDAMRKELEEWRRKYSS
jgi:arylsulfatase A-like enzyme